MHLAPLHFLNITQCPPSYPQRTPNAVQPGLLRHAWPVVAPVQTSIDPDIYRGLSGTFGTREISSIFPAFLTDYWIDCRSFNPRPAAIRSSFCTKASQQQSAAVAIQSTNTTIEHHGDWPVLTFICSTSQFFS